MLDTLDAFDTIGLTLSASDGKIVGRTTLQKLIYFETVTIQEIRLDEPYIAYFYGPFNRDVADSLGQMVFYDILDEYKVRTGHQGYAYRVTPKGSKIINRLEDRFGSTLDKMRKLIETCKKYCGLDPNSLSFAAKIHYMLESHNATGKSLAEDDLVRTGKSLGWNISKSEIQDGSKLLEQLELVKIQR